jgi:hypothetical protein
MSNPAKSWIDSAGGYRAVAERLSENPTTVHNWTRFNAFPLAQYHALRALASDIGIAPPSDRLFPFKVYPPQGTGDAA